jgi:GTP-binding protein LepA
VLKAKQKIRMMRTGGTYEVDKVGTFNPKLTEVDALGPGEVGYFVASIKEVGDTAIGDTITEERRPAEKALPGYKEVQPVVFCGLFPMDAGDFDDLRAAMGKLRLNDASFTWEMETQCRARHGLPLRFPRPPAPRNHPGTPQPRIRPRPDRDSPAWSTK